MGSYEAIRACLDSAKNRTDVGKCLEQEEGIKQERDLMWKQFRATNYRLCPEENKKPYPQFSEKDPADFFMTAFNNRRGALKCEEYRNKYLNEPEDYSGDGYKTAVLNEIAEAKRILKKSPDFGPINGVLNDRQAELLRYLDRMNIEAPRPKSEIFRLSMPVFAESVLLGSWISSASAQFVMEEGSISLTEAFGYTFGGAFGVALFSIAALYLGFGVGAGLDYLMDTYYPESISPSFENENEVRAVFSQQDK